MIELVKIPVGLFLMMTSLPIELFVQLFNVLFGTELENRYAQWIWDTFLRV